jgi:hypothetical protein
MVKVVWLLSSFPLFSFTLSHHLSELEGFYLALAVQLLSVPGLFFEK